MKGAQLEAVPQEPIRRRSKEGPLQLIRWARWLVQIPGTHGLLHRSTLGLLEMFCPDILGGRSAWEAASLGVTSTQWLVSMKAHSFERRIISEGSFTVGAPPETRGWNLTPNLSLLWSCPLLCLIFQFLTGFSQARSLINNLPLSQDLLSENSTRDRWFGGEQEKLVYELLYACGPISWASDYSVSHK